MLQIRSHLSYANVMATIAVFTALGGTTYAATGGNFILGRSNSASSTTALSAGTSGPAFKVTNTSGTGGSFNVVPGRQPFTVNTGVKVTNLNADKLDGLDSSSLISTSTLRRINFEATIPPLFGNSCSDGQLSGLNLQRHHLVLTPESESAQPEFDYSVLYKSTSGNAVLRTCNITRFAVEQPSRTRFNLVAIAP